MKALGFWETRPDALDWRARVLRPLGKIYAAGTARRLALGPRHKAAVPIICIGNINAGGTGKTPTVIATVERLRNHFHDPHIVSKGYGGSATGPLRVVPGTSRASEVGDEPLFLAAFAETWVAKDRLAGVQAAIDAGATAIVLDDGFQDARVQYDLSVVVVDAVKGFGNQLCLPAGPLREPIDAGLARADLLLTIGDTAAQAAFEAPLMSPPRVEASLDPLQTGMEWQGTRVLAFAGIGHPEKFFATLRGLGAEIAHAEPLADHQPLNGALLTRLERDAAALGAQLVTTEKDAARMPSRFLRKVMTLPVRLTLPPDNALSDALDSLPKP